MEVFMVSTALKEKAMDYFTLLDDEKAQMVISYMESFDYPAKTKKKTNKQRKQAAETKKAKRKTANKRTKRPIPPNRKP